MRKRLLVFFFLSLMQIAAFAQDKKITGKVTAADGSAIPGVSVMVEGSSTGTLTDPDGKFSITVPSGKTLLFRSIGFTAKSVAVGNNNVLNVQLAAQRDDLNEVVVVAYGTAKKGSITGSVSGIKAKDIDKRPVSNAVGVLEGTTGIQVNNTVGSPGAQPKIQIRGFSTVNGSNDPLYVIDGVLFTGNVTDINPADIESISVLKDAASAALYGNKASNGVVIMTTKRGAKGSDGNVNVMVNQGVYSRGVKDYKTMNTTDFMETMWKGYRNSLLSGSPSKYPTVDLANAKATETLLPAYLYLNIYDKPATQLFDGNGKLRSDAHILPGYADDLDWYKDMERLGHRQEYAINASTTTKKTNLYYSAGYLDEKGYVTNTDYKRFTGRINADVQAKSWLKYGFNLAGSHQVTNNINGDADNANSFTNPFMFARNIAPIYPVHMHNPTTGEYLLDEYGNKRFDIGDGNSRNQFIGRHVVYENLLNKDITTRNTVNGQIYMDVKFLKDFTFTAKGDLNVRNSDETTYNNAIVGDGAGNGGRGARRNYRYNTYTVQQLLNWNHSYGLHSVEGMVGHEYYSDNYWYLSGMKTNQILADATEWINFTKTSSLYDYQQNYRSEGYFARGRYSYADKYFLDGSFRRDGSSKFAPGVRWGNFYSVGGGWVLSKEDFFESLTKYVNYAKLRASYGQVGNDLTAARYAYMALFATSQNNNLGAVYKSQNAADIHWETSAATSAALDLRVFNRANISIEYFDKRSKDLLFDAYLPLSAGATADDKAQATITQNIGSVSNRGWEIGIDVDVLKNKDLKWNVGLNATFIKNEILRLPEQNRKDGIVIGNYKYAEGHGVNEFYTFQYAGVDQMTGNALYIPDNDKYKPDDKTGAHYQYLVNINGQNYTTNATYAKRDWSGSPIPNVFGSFNTSLTYKNFVLSGVFTYALGGKVYDDSYYSMMSMSGSVYQMHNDLLKAWNGVPEGMTATSPNRIDSKGIPVVDFNRSTLNNAMSSRFLKDGSYFVIKNIALSYQLPANLLQRIDIKNARLNLSVENLATFTKLQGMNPQQSFNGRSLNAFVTPRVVSFGVNVGL